jgi:hypothetical protein
MKNLVARRLERAGLQTSSGEPELKVIALRRERDGFASRGHEGRERSRRVHAAEFSKTVAGGARKKTPDSHRRPLRKSDLLVVSDRPKGSPGSSLTLFRDPSWGQPRDNSRAEAPVKRRG